MAATPHEGVILLDSNLEVLTFDQSGAALLNGISSAGEAREPRIPPKIWDAVLTLKNVADSRSPEPVSQKVRFHNGTHTCTCRIISVPLRDDPDQDLMILYITRDRSLSEALNQISTDYHLTARELQAIEGVVLGLTSKEVAIRMNISPNTVKAFLRLVMGKMGVTTRAGIVAKLLEPDDHP